MIYFDLETRQFASKTEKPIKAKDDPNAKRIGTLSVGILTRKVKRDRKGRKRRLRVEFEAPLISGSNSMTPVSAIANFKKELGDRNNRKINLNQKSFRKIVEAFKIQSPK